MDVEGWLSGQNKYTFNKPVWKMFSQYPYTVTWRLRNDLAELRSHSRYNYKYKYILNVTDIFSWYDWRVPIKDKKINSSSSALKSLFQNRKPITINQKMLLNLLIQLPNSFWNVSEKIFIRVIIQWTFL